MSGQDKELWSIVSFPKEEDFPYIVRGELNDKENIARTYLGVFQRTPMGENIAFPTEQIHAWIQRGRSGRVPVTAPSVALPTDLSDADRRAEAERILRDDLLAIDAPEGGSVFFALQAMPAEPRRLVRFLEGSERSMLDALRNIEPTRASGFRLPTFAEPIFAEDRYRVAVPRGESLSVTRTGITTLITGEEILTWAMDKRTDGKKTVNAVALPELTLDFWRFYVSEVLSRAAEPVGATLWRASIGTRGEVDEFLLHMPKGYRSDGWYSDWDLASLSQPFELPWETTTRTDPAELAFMTLEEVLARFSLDISAAFGQADGKIQQAAFRALR